MMMSEHEKVIQFLETYDVRRSGYEPLPAGFDLVEGYSPEMADTQDRLSRIIFGLAVARGWHPMVFATGLSILLTEFGWTDAHHNGRRIEVKRDEKE